MMRSTAPSSVALAGLALLFSLPSAAFARTRIAEPAAPPLVGLRAKAAPVWPEKAKGPIILAVSLADQRLTVWENGVVVARSAVSTGVAGHETPRGAFTLIQKQRMHRSNIYSNAPMPFMQRITWSGVALHQGHVTGRPASHGCIRLPADVAKKLFGYTKIGARVVVTDQPVAPADFTHPKLFNAVAAAPAPAALAPESAPVIPVRLAALHPSGEAIPSKTELAVLPPESELEPAVEAPRGEAPKGEAPEIEAPKTQPARQPSGHVSIFISARERKLFVRQGFEPVYESPVEIRPGAALGAHLFTVMDLDQASGAVRWSRVSLPVKDAHAAGAAEALDRIEIPEDARLEVGRRLSAGASLLVSDQGLGRETGKTATDFILLTP